MTEFECFVEGESDIEFMDLLMIAHSFHKTVVLDVTDNLNRKDRNLLLRAVIETFTESVEREIKVK